MHLYLCMLLLNLLFCDINCVCCSHNTTSIEKEKRCDIQETREEIKAIERENDCGQSVPLA